MKKRVSIILIIGLFLSTVILSGLWLYARNDKSEILLLAQAGVTDAYTQFTEYQNTGEESCYWYGVSAFRSFEQAYYLLVQGTNDTTHYTFCNEVYGDLVLNPTRSQTHIADIIAVLQILSDDVEDENGYLRMSDLRNSIQE